MPGDLISVELLRQFIQQQETKKFQETRYSSDRSPFTMQRLVLDLTTERAEGNAYKFPMPVTALHVEAASDTQTEIRMSVQDNSSIQVQNYKTLKLNDVIRFGRQMSGVQFTWEAQSAKEITIVLFVDVDFQSGSQISVTSGGIALNEGSVSEVEDFAIAVATAVELFDLNVSRFVGKWRNDTGETVWINSDPLALAGGGDGPLDDGVGYAIPDGEEVVWRNTGILYVWSYIGAARSQRMIFT